MITYIRDTSRPNFENTMVLQGTYLPSKYVASFKDGLSNSLQLELKTLLATAGAGELS